MIVKKITRMALLSAIALAIFWVEAQIPVPIPIPGVKLGLANVVTIFAVFALGPWEAAGILLVRILLGSLLFGQMMGLWYALAGGALAWLATWGLRRILTGQQIWVAGCLGADSSPACLPAWQRRHCCVSSKEFRNRDEATDFSDSRTRSLAFGLV